MGFLYKYFLSSSLRTYLSVSLFFAVVFTVILLFSTDGDIKLSLIVGLVIFIVVFIFAYLNDHFGEKKHISFVHGKVFREIKDKMNLDIERLNNNKYKGLKGVYKEYYFKIYYDWNTSISNRNIYREICIMLYFSPLLTSDDSFDIRLLDKLSEKYKDKGIFVSKSEIKLEAAYLKVSRGYTLFTSTEDIAKQIERAVEIANIENLKPIDEKVVNGLIEEDSYYYGPDIETFYDV
jgi:hypothetical protein